MMVWQGRSTFQLPYYLAEMKHTPIENGWHYFSQRQTNQEEWIFEAKQHRKGDEYQASPNTLIHFLSERYCLYVVEPAGKVMSVDVHHKPWPIYDSSIEIKKNTMIRQFSGIDPLTTVCPSITWSWKSVDGQIDEKAEIRIKLS